jgi:hypothetical protein
MGQTIIQINDLIDQHGKSFAECKGCSICKQIEQLRLNIEGEDNPKVKRILAKGLDMTKSDIAYLLQHNVTQREIRKHMTIDGAIFADMMIAWGFGKRKKKRGDDELAKVNMTVEGYERLKADGLNDTQVAKRKGVSPATLWAWKKRNGLIASTSDSKAKETNSPRKEKEQPQEDYRSVIDSLKRELEVREKAIKDLEEKNTYLQENTVSREKYSDLEVEFQEIDAERLLNFEKYKEQEAKYQNEHALVINLDQELENIREQLRKENTLVERYKQVNESLEGMVRSYHEYAFPAVSEK